MTSIYYDTKSETEMRLGLFSQKYYMFAADPCLRSHYRCFDRCWLYLRDTERLKIINRELNTGNKQFV